MLFFITHNIGNSKDAGTKAIKDINTICVQCGWKEIFFLQPKNKKNIGINYLNKILVNLKNWRYLKKIVKPGDYVLYQHPMYFGTKFANIYIPKLRKKKIKFIALIHDLESLRKYTYSSENDYKSYMFGDLVLLRKFDAIIAHNKSMIKYLVNHGFDERKIICLEIFDYLCDTQFVDYNLKSEIVIGGNLNEDKSAYIYKLAEKNPDIKINLFGENYTKKIIFQNMIYHGSYSPEKVTEKLQGAYGLIWDGPAIEGCIGNNGNYLKYNSPHKTSMYLAAGIPIITWKNAAIAGFVVDNNVGIVLENLEKLDKVLIQVSNKQYNIMSYNAKQISKKLREGYYFKTAIKKAIHNNL